MRWPLPRPFVRWAKRQRDRLRGHRDRLFSADGAALAAALGQLGVRAGDVMYVRSSYDDMRSIQASPMEIIAMLRAAVGETGTLVMPSYPVTGLSRDYLAQHPHFDWRRTPSRAGLLTELFRRMPATERSLHPTHPLAASGPRAPWLTEGHETSEAPFDERSPFQKLLQLDAWVLSMGRFEAMTLRHFADHQIRDRIPYALYEAEPVRVELVARDGSRQTMLTRANNADLGCDHRSVLRQMIRDGVARTVKVGRVPVTMVRLPAYVAAYRRYHQAGLFHHFLKSERLAQPAGVRR